MVLSAHRHFHFHEARVGNLEAMHVSLRGGVQVSQVKRLSVAFIAINLTGIFFRNACKVVKNYRIEQLKN